MNSRSNIITDLTSLELACSHYLTHYADGNAHTADAKQRDISTFFEFVCRKLRTQAPLFENITKGLLEAFIEDRLAAQEAPATINRRLASVKHFLSVSAELLRVKNPGRGVRGLMEPERAPAWLDAVDLEKLRAVANEIHTPFERSRAKLILELGLQLGLRCWEIADLRMAHLSLDKNEVLNFRRKNKRFARKPVNAVLKLAFESYLPERTKHLEEHYPMFLKTSAANRVLYPVILSHWNAMPCKPDSWKMDCASIRRLMRALGRKAGIEKMHTHRLRHTFVKRFFDATNNLALTAQAADHASVSTTMRYMTASRDELEKGFKAIG